MAAAGGEEKPQAKGRDDAVKIILLGDSAVGKSKLVERFLMDDYEPYQDSTYALTLFRHNTKVDGEDVAVDFWDTAGQERFNNMHPSYYFGAHACVMVFDITRKPTYQNLSKWFAELQEFRKGIPTVVLANKIDLDMRVTKKSFNFAAKRNLPFSFVSAATGTNVAKVFSEVIKMGYHFKKNPTDDFFSDVMQLIHEDNLGVVGDE